MFDFDLEAMTYNKAKKTDDLETYGLLSYEALKDVISKHTFDSNHCEALSVAFGKGLISCKQFKTYLARFADYIFCERT